MLSGQALLSVCILIAVSLGMATPSSGFPLWSHGQRNLRHDDPSSASASNSFRFFVRFALLRQHPRHAHHAALQCPRHSIVGVSFFEESSQRSGWHRLGRPSGRAARLVRVDDVRLLGIISSREIIYRDSRRLTVSCPSICPSNTEMSSATRQPLRGSSSLGCLPWDTSPSCSFVRATSAGS